jgi:hypothetical protein
MLLVHARTQKAFASFEFQKRSVNYLGGNHEKTLAEMFYGYCRACDSIVLGLRRLRL